MKHGAAIHGIGADLSGDKGFLRLHYYDNPSIADLDAAKEADFDNDLLTNWNEVTIHGTNPTDPDTDGDGLPDGWEAAHQLDPLDNGTTNPQNGADGMFQSGNLTNSQAFNAGVQAVAGATVEDLDGDSRPNLTDAAPLDGAVTWEISSTPSYILQPLDDWDPDTHGYPLMLTNGGEVKCSAAYHDASGWHQIINLAEYQWPFDSPTVTPYTYRYENDTEDQPVELSLEFPDGSMSDDLRLAVNASFSGTGMYLPVVWQISNPTQLPEILGVSMSSNVLADSFPSVWQWPRISRNGIVNSTSVRDFIAYELFRYDANNPAQPGVRNQFGISSNVDSSSDAHGNLAASIQQASWPTNKLWVWPIGQAGAYVTSADLIPHIAHRFDPDTVESVRAAGASPDGRSIVNVDGSVIIQGADGKWHIAGSMPGVELMSMTGTGLIETGGPEPRVWRNATTHPLRSLCQQLQTDAPDTIQVRDINDHGTMLIRTTKNGIPQIGILQPVTLTWQEFAGYGNVSDHIDPWTNETNGKRIFPGSKNPDEPAILDKLELIVKTNPSLAGKTVFVKSFDVDDTTSEAFDLDLLGTAPVIDINETGNDNLDDFKQTPIDGQFWTGSAWGGNEFSKVLDSNGEAKFTFGVGMQPGNNYRVVAVLDDTTLLDSVQVTNPDATEYLGNDFLDTSGLPSSPLLTVWRRLWVEVDTMEKIKEHPSAYKANDLAWEQNTFDLIATHSVASPQTGTGFRIPPIHEDRENILNLENGEIYFNDGNEAIFGTQTGSDFDVVAVQGDFTGTQIGSEVRVYDDDGFGLPALTGAQFHLEIVGPQLENLFKSSFIEPVESLSYNQNRVVPFKANILDLFEAIPTEYSSHDLVESDLLWVAPLVIAYQGGHSEDGDPNSESETYGVTQESNGIEKSFVFVEACREPYDSSLRTTAPDGLPLVSVAQAASRVPKFIVAISAHEIGHQPGYEPNRYLNLNHHDEEGLMRQGGADPVYPDKENFTATTVERFRTSKKWSK